MNRLTCREFDEVVHGLVRLELLDIALREDALAHAARCTNCSERMNTARALAEATEALGDLGREQDAPLQVKDQLIATFRTRRRRAVWWQVFEWSTTGAVAAMGLLLIWNVYGHTRAPSAPLPRKDISSQSREALEASELVAPGTTAAADINASLAGSGGEVDASDFVPVPYSTELAPQEPGMIVRVQLTPDSLAELGYPIADVSSDDLISADVLVGEDGWPRAVRLVQ